ncbi:MAG: GNAT family N-acetyltransferase [Pseudomonadales bacterium]|nr:GNAT family N-acetyltransferase [Pseudomonadales bacterium]
MRFRIEQVDWRDSRAQLSEIRIEVFVREQGVPIDEEWDQWDASSRHWLAYSIDVNKPVATVRLTLGGQIGRMAVLTNYRHSGVGSQLLEEVIKVAQLSFEKVYLHAQCHAMGFYEHAGFKAVGSQFDEAGIAHQRMMLEFNKPK